MPESRAIIVFDIDGTLLHSIGHHQGALLEAYAELGVAIGDRELSDFPDHTDSAIYDLLLAEARGEPASAADLEQLDSVLERHYLQRTQSAAPLAVTGAGELLAYLATDERVSVAFATGSMRSVAGHKLAQLGVDVDGAVLVTASDLLTREEIVARAIDLAAGSSPGPSRAVSIGDGIWDLRAADALGVPFVAVESGTHSFGSGPVHSVIDLGSLTTDQLLALAGDTNFPLSTVMTQKEQ